MVDGVRRTNAISSLFGGIAQGFQLRRQIDTQKRQQELQEKGLKIREQQLELKQQAAEDAKKFQDLFRGLFPQPGGGAGGLPPLNIPSAAQPTTQAPAPVPAPTTAQGQQPNILDILQSTISGAAVPTRPTAQAPLPTALSPRPVIRPQEQGIVETDIELPETGRVKPALPAESLAGRETVEVPFDVAELGIAPPIPTTAPTPIPAPIIPTKPRVDRARQVPQGVSLEQQLSAVRNFRDQLDLIGSRPDSSRTVTFTAPGISISKTFGKNPTPNQLFNHFNSQISKAFPNITASEKAQILADSALRDAPLAQKFFNREFNAAVNRSFLNKKALSGGPLTTSKKNQLLANAVEETVDEFAGFVSKRHEKLFQSQKVDKFNLPEKVQAELQKTFPDFTAFQDAFVANSKGTEAILETAITKAESIKGAKVNLKIRADGKLEAIIQTTDKNGNISFDTQVVSQSDFNRPLTIRQTPQAKATEGIVRKAGAQIVASRDIKSLINNIAQDIRAIPEDQLNSSLGISGGFNIFSNNLIDQLKGFANSSFLPGAGGAQQILDSFQKSKLFQQLVAGKGAQAQRFLVQYITLILKSASLIGLGEARAISDKDFDRVKAAISASGATSLKATLSSLNDEANRQDAFATGVAKDPEKIFRPQAPNPDPFTGEVKQPGKPFLPTPNFFGPETAPAPQQQGQPTPDKRGALGEALNFLNRENF